MKMTPALQKIFDQRKQLNAGRQRIACKLNSCEVFLYDNNMGKPCAVGYRGRSLNQDFRYRFTNEERRQQHVADFMKRCHDREVLKLARKTETKTRQLHVGDVLQAQWGYDQTNIDYYLVTAEIGKTMVEITEIGQLREQGDIAMTGSCVPDKTNLIGKPMKKQPDGTRIKIESFASAHLITPTVIEGIEVYQKANWTSYA